MVHDEFLKGDPDKQSILKNKTFENHSVMSGVHCYINRFFMKLDL